MCGVLFGRGPRPVFGGDSRSNEIRGSNRQRLALQVSMQGQQSSADDEHSAGSQPPREPFPQRTRRFEPEPNIVPLLRLLWGKLKDNNQRLLRLPCENAI